MNSQSQSQSQSQVKGKRTPGPWHRNIPPASKYTTIFAGRNTHICHLERVGLTADEIEGNCNLIAAAPELLDALKRLADYTFGTHEYLAENTEDIERVVDAAIAKAEGGGE